MFRMCRGKSGKQRIPAQYKPTSHFQVSETVLVILLKNRGYFDEKYMYSTKYFIYL